MRRRLWPSRGRGNKSRDIHEDSVIPTPPDDEPAPLPPEPAEDLTTTQEQDHREDSSAHPASASPENVAAEQETRPDHGARQTHPSWAAAQLPEIANPKGIKELVPQLVLTKPGRRVPGMTADAARVGSAWVAAASARGALHHEFGTTRQDTYLITCTEDEQWILFALADGVSEAEHSHIAAELVCRIATDAIREHLQQTNDPQTIDYGEIVQRSREAIRERSARALREDAAADVDQAEVDRAIAKKVMSTTLQVGIVQARPDGKSRQYVSVRLAGDGSTYVLDHAGFWRVLCMGKQSADGVIISDVTALPRDVGPASVEAGTLSTGDVLVVCTDGVGDELGDGRNELGEFLREAWSSPVSATEFLRTISFVKTGATDDRTAVAVWS